ncbi:MAG: cysteine desulfurase-like protein [Actinomycetes bacterium]
MAYDVERIRALYPALQGDRVWLDGAAGTQSPTSVIDAMAETYRVGTSNGGGVFASSRASDEITDAARNATADLVGARTSDGLVLGPNMTTLTYRFAQALARDWRAGDNLIVTELDHDANVRPWVQWAEATGVEVRWARIDVESGELPLEQFNDLLDERTQLVAVTGASNVLGTRPDVRGITDAARSVGALSYVDGVHSTAHGVVDVSALGSDFYVTSAYKWDGPHVGCLAADRALLDRLVPFKLASSANEVPDRFEWGTPSFANFAGVTAAVDHLAELDSEATGSRRERIVASLSAAHEHESVLLDRVLAALDGDERITLYGHPKHRTATVFFRVAGESPEQTTVRLNKAGINAWHGHNYAWEVTRALGIRDTGSAVRVSLSHYTNTADVDRFLANV